MDPQKVLTDFLEDRIGIEELRGIVRHAEGDYKRPKLDAQTIDEYADWEIRVQVLSGRLTDISKAAFREADRDISRALRMAEAFRAFSTLVPESNAMAQADFLWGYLQRRNGHHSDAVEPLRNAANAYRKLDDSLLEVTALSYLSDALRSSKRLDEALATAEFFEQRAKDCNLNGHLAVSLRDKGEILMVLGRGLEAIDELKHAVQVRRQLNSTEASLQLVPSLPAFLNSLGKSSRSLGRFEDAVVAFLEVAALELNDGNRDLHALAKSEIGYTYGQAGEPGRGAEYLRDAAQLAEAAGNHSDATRWREQADIWQGKPAARVSDSRSHEPWHQATTTEEAYRLSAMAEVLATEGKHAEALMAARSALGWAQTKRDLGLEVSTRSIIAKVHSDLDDLQEAVVETRNAIRAADAAGNKPAQLLLRGNLANGLVRQQKIQAAAEVLLDAIAQSLDLLAKTEASEFRQSIVAASMPIFELYANLASQTEKHDALLWITELARARNLYGWIKAAAALEDSSTRTPQDPDPIETLRELRAVEVELEVRHLEKKIDLTTMRSLKSRREKTREQLDGLFRAKSSSGMKWEAEELNVDASLLDGMLDEIIEPGGGILSLFGVEEGVCPLFLARSEGKILKAGKFIPWERAERERDIEAWESARSSQSLSVMRAGYDQLLDHFRTALFDRLLPFLSEMSVTSLAVIPSGELQLIPYWDFLDRCASVVSLTIAPSLGVLRLCLRRERGAQGKTLLLSDPTRTLDFAPLERDLVANSRTSGKILEPRSIDEIYDWAGSCALFHAATHGMFFPQRPYHSGLVATTELGEPDLFDQYVDGGLLPVDRSTSGGARLLTVADIMARLSLRSCRLAVLSACESGIPRQHGGGEMTGLPASLLIAGAQSVIASLWAVNDGAAALLMDAFYRTWARGSGDKPSPARALAIARKALRVMPREEAEARLGLSLPGKPEEYPFAHPLHTDAFACFGSW
jgi:tetratricopeptide (TPR) repeat protein